MTIPAEFEYRNEDDFIQRFLIPLLNRLGFSVVNYHGTREFGRDLIFAEIDRFGHVRYHGLQAKYQSSVSLSDSHDLIRDCHQAFNNPFVHPQSGVTGYISSFYAVNSGDISEQAGSNYHNSLIKHYGDNARLLDGKALVGLDRWAAISRSEAVREALTGLLIEVRANRLLIQPVLEMLQGHLDDARNHLPLYRFRGQAATNFLVRPVVTSQINVQDVLGYSVLVDQFRDTMAYLSSASTSNPAQRTNVEMLRNNIEHLKSLGDAIERQVMAVLGKLGPLTGL